MGMYNWNVWLVCSGGLFKLGPHLPTIHVVRSRQVIVLNMNKNIPELFWEYGEGQFNGYIFCEKNVNVGVFVAKCCLLMAFTYTPSKENAGTFLCAWIYVWFMLAKNCFRFGLCSPFFENSALSFPNKPFQQSRKQPQRYIKCGQAFCSDLFW